MVGLLQSFGPRLLHQQLRHLQQLLTPAQQQLFQIRPEGVQGPVIQLHSPLQPDTQMQTVVPMALQRQLQVVLAVDRIRLHPLAQLIQAQKPPGVVAAGRVDHLQRCRNRLQQWGDTAGIPARQVVQATDHQHHPGLQPGVPQLMFSRGWQQPAHLIELLTPGPQIRGPRLDRLQQQPGDQGDPPRHRVSDGRC